MQSSTECKTLGVSQNPSQSLSTHAKMCPACVIARVGVVDRERLRDCELACMSREAPRFLA